MKLLLTSAGIANKTIAKTLEQLLGKPAQGVPLAFVPTAANVEAGDKHWLIDDYTHCRKAGFAVDIVDISAISRDIWQPRLEQAEVLFFGGGNMFHLMHWMDKSGLNTLLPDLLKTRIYAGISAGSCVAGPTICNSVQNLVGDKYQLEINEGLGLVDFQFIPHLNSQNFDKIRKENLEKAARDITEPVYALDDNSALVFDDGKIDIVSEGEWCTFNS